MDCGNRQKPQEQRYGSLLADLAEPELLYLTLLIHDIGKGAPQGESHVEAGLRLLGPILGRLQLEAEACELVSFCSQPSGYVCAAAVATSTTRPRRGRCRARRQPGAAAHALPADLRRYHSGQSEAMTPWKAEDMWQLFMAASNYLDHRPTMTASIRNARPSASSPRCAHCRPNAARNLRLFLAGLPRRYLLTQTPQLIAEHCEMRYACSATRANRFAPRGSAQSFDGITSDRPMLFATISGVLTGWGMNIIKAGAFSNQAAKVVDTFLFADPFRTLELNPQERERFQQAWPRCLPERPHCSRCSKAGCAGPRGPVARAVGETKLVLITSVRRAAR